MEDENRSASMANSFFISPNETFDGAEEEAEAEAVDRLNRLVLEPVVLIVARVLFALLISTSLILNLLLVVAVVRRRRLVHVVYAITAAMIVPDTVFYAKLITELVSWGEVQPSWAKSDWSCGLWQFSTHWYPIAYAVLLVAIVYHAFITLFLDYSGSFEESVRKFLLPILVTLMLTVTFVTAPSAIYSEVKQDTSKYSHYHQFCGLSVSSLVVDKQSIDLAIEAAAAYRLVYEVIIPYILPLLFLAFPYVALLVGILRSVAAASHAEYSTKLTVVVTLWLVTTFLMMHVTSILKNVFSVLSVWHRLMVVFDAYDDKRVPMFQTYIHVLAYILTCVWGIIRASLCFKYNIKLRKALGK